MTMKQLRNKAGYRQTDIAIALGTKQTTVSMWENGNAYPHATVLARLAEMLDCTEGDIVSAITEARQAQKTPPAEQTA